MLHNCTSNKKELRISIQWFFFLINCHKMYRFNMGVERKTRKYHVSVLRFVSFLSSSYHFFRFTIFQPNQSRISSTIIEFVFSLPISSYWWSFLFYSLTLTNSSNKSRQIVQFSHFLRMVNVNRKHYVNKLRGTEHDFVIWKSI